MGYKILVAHPAQQHSFRLATALKKSGFLFKYSTTVYDKKKSFTGLLKSFLKGDNLKRANGRSCESLMEDDIKQFYELHGLLLLLLQRIDKSKYFYTRLSKHIVDKFGVKVAKYAIKNKVDAVIMYDTLSYKAFEILKKESPQIIRILDMSAPNTVYMDKVYREDLNKGLDFNSNLNNKINSPMYSQILQKNENEIQLANYYIAASTFTVKSIEYSNILKNKIFICTYGVDSKMFTPSLDRKNDNNKFKCIFIGRVTHEKGAYHLLRSIDNIDNHDLTLTMVGTYDQNSDYYQEYKDKVEFTGHVTQDKIVKLCQNADVLVFPSLADGFGLSVSEALSCGLPVICSENAGVSDFIIDGYNGFKIPAGDINSITEKLEWCINNRKEIVEMGKNARKTAKKYTWELYEDSITDAIKKMIQND
jgi:glycosyltransferase involved in cell wall biosynthesis